MYIFIYIHLSDCIGESGQAALVKGPVTVCIYIYKLFVYYKGVTPQYVGIGRVVGSR